jgi:hypothetical protein
MLGIQLGFWRYRRDAWLLQECPILLGRRHDQTFFNIRSVVEAVIDCRLDFFSGEFQIRLGQRQGIITHTVGYLLNDLVHGDGVEDI